MIHRVPHNTWTEWIMPLAIKYVNCVEINLQEVQFLLFRPLPWGIWYQVCKVNKFHGLDANSRLEPDTVKICGWLQSAIILPECELQLYSHTALGHFAVVTVICRKCQTECQFNSWMVYHVSFIYSLDGPRSVTNCLPLYGWEKEVSQLIHGFPNGCCAYTHMLRLYYLDIIPVCSLCWLSGQVCSLMIVH